MKRNGKQKRKNGNDTGYYEIPELSDKYGFFVVVEGRQNAQRLAQENGAGAVWEVIRGFVPMPTGRIWGLVDGHWIKVPEDYRCCSCAECAATAPTHH